MKLSENNLAEQKAQEMCGSHYVQPIGLIVISGGHEHMSITKDLNMDGVCEWLDP